MSGFFIKVAEPGGLSTRCDVAQSLVEWIIGPGQSFRFQKLLLWLKSEEWLLTGVACFWSWWYSSAGRTY